MTGERERLPRLLALVPYLQAHPGVAIATAAADFAVTEEQLRRDLQLLWMCGLPGHGPGDLIDLSFEGDTVSVIFDAGMSRPLRLTAEEALALVVALRTLAETPGLTDRDAVERALAKVEAAAGGSIDAADTVAVALDHVDRLQLVLQRAVDEQRALPLRYYTATRDETTDRIVDPHAGVRPRRPRLPGGLVPAGRGHAGVPGRPHRGRPACSTNRPGRRPRPTCATCPRACTRRRPSTCSSCCGSRPPTPGSPTTTRDRGHRDRGRPAPDQPAGRRPGLGAGARPRLGRAGRGALAGVAGRVDGREAAAAIDAYATL